MSRDDRRLSGVFVAQVLLVAAAVWIVVELWSLLILLVLALTLAGAMLPVAEWGDARRIPRVVTVASLYVLGAGLVALVGWLIFPVLAAQAREFWRDAPEYLGRIQGTIEAIRGWAEARGLPQGAPSPGAGGTMLQALVRRTLEATAGVLGAAFGGIVALFLAAYIVIDARRIGEGLLALVPADHRDRVAAMARPVLDRMGGYVRGQMAVAVCVSIILSVGLGLLGVRFGLFIGILAGALNLIPFVGTWVAAGVALLVAINQSLPLALWTALFFWVEQLVEGKLLVPLLLGRNVGLHPLAVLLALLAGARLAGLVGALAAIPIVAGGAEILRRTYLAGTEPPPGRNP